MRVSWLLLVLLVLGSASSGARAQEFYWAKQLGGPCADNPYNVAVDSSGNVYTVGEFSCTADFDPGPGVYNLTSAGSSDVFISKLDSAGNFVWARQLGGTSDDYTTYGGVTVDSAGNVYTVGTFHGTADFDPGPGVFNLTSAGSADAFISKLDSAGNFVWAKRLGGANGEGANGVRVDTNGNVYTVGSFFASTVDFDPGPGVYNLTSAGSTDVFVSKLDSAGNFVWARQLGGTSTDSPYDAAMDSGANIYTVGSFGGTADFDPGPGVFNLTSAGSSDVFISKLDSAGNFVWAKQLGGTNGETAFDVALDATGNVYTVGVFFADTVDFDPGPGVYNLTSAGANDAFISKLDSAGNFVWARRLGGASNEYGYGVSRDSANNVYVVGDFSGTVDFDPGAGVNNMTSAGNEDVFILKLDSAGSFVWAKRLGGTGLDQAHDVAVDVSGNICTVGNFGGTADFDPGPGTYNLTSGAVYDTFVSKLRPIGAGAVPDGDSVTGVPLTVSKASGSQLLLSWGSSCSPGDADYEVYEGSIGTFTSHVPRLCSTGGATGAIVAPSTGNRYYLVVPTTGSVEGSYGRNSSDVERPPSVQGCLPQAMASCP